MATTLNVVPVPEPRIREQNRNEVRWERQLHRKAELDVNRANLGEMLQEVAAIESVTPQEIKGLASRIKRRKHADLRDLVKLSYGFQQSGENISEFVRITGAINVVVKELTGHDSDRQLLAAECLCNLSLGDEVCCEKVATFAGTYLVALVENLSNRRVATTCMWTLQNMISSGTKAMKILNSQGIIPSLTHLLEVLEKDDLLAEILLAIELILDHDPAFISPETIHATILPLTSSKEPQLNSLKVVYKALCLTGFETLDVETAPQIVKHVVQQLVLIGTENGAEAILSIRILANLVAINEGCVDFLVAQCQQHNFKLSQLFNLFSEDGQVAVCREILWLVGNVSKTGSGNEFKRFVQFDNFVECVIIPKALLV
ncbi:transmembrane and coiled-coil domain-containing protein 6-like [Culex pipiens pallens]|uniref:transmembrane and coiled-coil domain-containing protein 6-like n=1 Tax=Culex pipiens pallens TaxID=42434 RepID=UPI001952D000|nr:transmembrane and coiled-coil domain-containing protein 6-like [Culex pipiens pallens]